MSSQEVRFEQHVVAPDDTDELSRDRRQGPSPEQSQPDDHLDPYSRPATPTTPIYYGSYAPSAASSPPASGASSPRPRFPPAISQTQLESLLPKQHTPLPDFGLVEDRDGFFDAMFYAPSGRTRLLRDQILWNEEASPDSGKPEAADIPSSSENGRPSKERDRCQSPVSQTDTSPKNHGPLSVAAFFPRQIQDARSFILAMKTVKGVRVLRSVLGVWITFIMCLIPATEAWLGRYSYVAVISALINHSGRSIGSQIDGAFMTCLGTAAGLGWGSLALYVSNSTGPARDGYGGVLAAFLVMLTVAIAMIRCLFIRFYQAVICAGVAVAYVVLAEAGDRPHWIKVKEYGVPFAIGQGVALVVAGLVFPTAGAKALGRTFHEALDCAHKALNYPRGEDLQLNYNLAFNFVKISTAIRDFTIDFTYSRINAEDARVLRNEVQRVTRALLSLKADPGLWKFETSESHVHQIDGGQTDDQHLHDVVKTLKDMFRYPMLQLITSMSDSIYSIDNTFCILTGYSPHGLVDTKSLETCLAALTASQVEFDRVDAEVVNRSELLPALSYNVEAIELFLFIHPIRQASNAILSLLKFTTAMKSRSDRWRVQAPSYPWRKAVLRSNAQVRHDRGGLNAGFYFHSKRQLDRMITSLLTTKYIPHNGRKRPNATQSNQADHPPRAQNDKQNPESHQVSDRQTRSSARSMGPAVKTVRYSMWRIVHRLQGFEGRFALKVALVTTFLSIPAYLDQSRNWWNENQAWWTIVTVWLMMHPRVGGTFQDLFTRCFCAVLGALWGAFTAAAGRAVPSKTGGKIVTSVMAALFLVPMIYRFTISTHPRSGFVGCIAFIVVSLELSTMSSSPIVKTAWTRGLAFVVGIVSAVVVNWVLWPFVARHELRKSVSAMMMHQALLYRSVISRYFYFADGEKPGPKDVERSEILEGRVREGFVRMRQLLELTGHELRLRAPFDPAPYTSLITSLETLFEHLVRLRQSSLYFQPDTLTPDPSMLQTLSSSRRDAVAAVLMNLYILACSLRTGCPVPRYLPGPAAARKKLLDKMERLEAEFEARRRGLQLELARMESPRSAESAGSAMSPTSGDDGPEEPDPARRWETVYHYAYSSALTDIVASIQQLQRWTRQIVGEEAW